MLKDVTNNEGTNYENTPLRPPSIPTSKSNSSVKETEEELIHRDRVRKMAGPAWKRRMEDRLAVAKSVNLKETIVIENGEQVNYYFDCACV